MKSISNTVDYLIKKDENKLLSYVVDVEELLKRIYDDCYVPIERFYTELSIELVPVARTFALATTNGIIPRNKEQAGKTQHTMWGSVKFATMEDTINAVMDLPLYVDEVITNSASFIEELDVDDRKDAVRSLQNIAKKLRELSNKYGPDRTPAMSP